MIIMQSKIHDAFIRTGASGNGGLGFWLDFLYTPLGHCFPA